MVRKKAKPKSKTVVKQRPAQKKIHYNESSTIWDTALNCEANL